MLDAVLNYLKRPGDELNRHHDKSRGVLFYERNGKRCAAAISRDAFVEIENIDVNPRGQFYNFVRGEWIPTHDHDPHKLLDIVYGHRSYVCNMQVPYTNMINFIEQLGDRIEKTRVIFSPFKLNKDTVKEFVVIFDAEKKYRNPNIQKTFVIDRDSRMPANEVFPGVKYKVFAVRDDAENIYVNVVERFGLMRMGLNYSEKIFIPDNIEEINSLVRLPDRMIMPINSVDMPNGYNVSTHASALLMYKLLPSIGISESLFVEILLGPDSSHHIMMRSADIQGRPRVNITLGALAYEGYGPQLA